MDTSLPHDASSLLIISVCAKPGMAFESYDLVQAIAATGMQFGEMNIFHYYLPTLQGKITLFSLASLTNPGFFDLDHLGNFSCQGLTLFMDAKKVPDPKMTFELMLDVALQLADDLNGELRAGQKDPWDETVLQKYRSRAQMLGVTTSL